METGKIVVVDDEKIVTSAFKTLLKVEGFNNAHFFNNPKEISAKCASQLVGDFARMRAP